MRALTWHCISNENHYRKDRGNKRREGYGLLVVAIDTCICTVVIAD